MEALNPLNEIETAFSQLSLNAHARVCYIVDLLRAKEVRDQWMRLERPTLVAALLVSPTLESNLTKILQ